MKNKVLKSDLLIIKIFLKTPYPFFVEHLQLEMEFDYISGFCYRLLNKKELQHNLIDLSQDVTKKIELYIEAQGCLKDRDFYKLVLSVQAILHKYYNVDGSFKY